MELTYNSKKVELKLCLTSKFSIKRMDLQTGKGRISAGEKE